MYIVVNHQITNPEKFLSIVAKGVPANDKFKVQAFLPAVSHSTATCFWEAPNVEELQNFLDPMLGDSSRNIYNQVDEKIAKGLPKEKEAAMAMFIN